MSKHDRDLLIAILVLAMAIYFCFTSFAMPGRGEFIESPGIFPGLMGITLFILGTAYALRSIIRGGKIRLTQFGPSFIGLFKSKENRPVLLGILFPGIYIFIGIPLIGFYYSSALFMMIMFFAYVKRWKRWSLPIIAIGITLLLYLTFNKLFMLQIR